MFLTGLSDDLLNCVFGICFKDVSRSCSSWGWQHCISPCSLLFVSTVKTWVHPSPGHSVPATITLGIMRMPHPQGYGKGKICQDSAERVFCCCCFWLYCISELGKFIQGVFYPFFRPAVNLYSPTRDSHAIVSNQETQLNTSEISVQHREPLWLLVTVLKE